MIDFHTAKMWGHRRNIEHGTEETVFSVCSVPLPELIEPTNDPWPMLARLADANSQDRLSHPSVRLHKRANTPCRLVVAVGSGARPYHAGASKRCAQRSFNHLNKAASTL